MGWPIGATYAYVEAYGRIRYARKAVGSLGMTVHEPAPVTQ